MTYAAAFCAQIGNNKVDFFRNRGIFFFANPVIGIIFKYCITRTFSLACTAVNTIIVNTKIHIIHNLKFFPFRFSDMAADRSYPTPYRIEEKDNPNYLNERKYCYHYTEYVGITE
jgi:hypothetical protein